MYQKLTRIKTFRALTWLMVLVFLNLAVGCSYYKVKTVEKTEEKQKSLGDMYFAQKYVILHHGADSWHLTNIQLNDTNKVITATRGPVDPHHSGHFSPEPGLNRYRPKKGDPTYEVHIYASELQELENSKVSLQVSAITKIDIYDEAVGATVASHLGTIVGVGMGILVIFLIVVILTKSSCPFVYTYDGNAYHFAGEMYGGAIYSSLERDDYLPLPGFAAVNENYQLKISNELLERQYTDLANLLVVEHPQGTEVIIDKNGNVHTISDPQLPEKAISVNGRDIRNSLVARDGNSYWFNDDSLAGGDFNKLHLTFKKPEGAKTAKLTVNAKNSLWLDYIFGKFYESFGTYYNTFAEKQKTVPASVNNKWSQDQGIPLSVYLKTGKGWEPAGYFNVIGPLASRDMVMSLDVSKIQGEHVEIRLECGFMFWEMDYAALDFSDDVDVTVHRLLPVSALDETGTDVSALLASTDKKYLFQPVPGNEVTVKYQSVKAAAGKVCTAFLHSRGYYEYIRNYTGKPDFVYLNSFKKKGRFDAFSRSRYFEMVNDPNFFASAIKENNGN